MSEGKQNIIRYLLENYEIQNVEDIQDALKDLLGGTIQNMLEAELDGQIEENTETDHAPQQLWRNSNTGSARPQQRF
jgi:hypothetical protein